ncbi:23S rRNA (uracil(1939)-C(5))-methyltransferase RlmD [Mycoplasmatota bacterium]|nr:23S rRNA (uracil(1939)-C(5))-methyltransferase RlmD [Mycoplasmatota bacterium]
MKLTIKSIDINGNGIAYYKKKVVFVKGALPGEIVDVDLEIEKENYYQASIKSIIKKSNSRVKPKCDIYSKCGGCSLMHLVYGEQLKYKSDRVKEAFSKYASISPKVNKTIGMELPYNYRNKVQLVVKKLKNKVVLGLYEEGSHFVTEMDNCLIQDKAINNSLVEIKNLLNNIKLDISSKGLHKIMIRTNKENEQQITLITGKKMKLDYLVNRLSELKNVTGIFSIINNKKSGNLYDCKSIKLFGKSRLIKKISSKSYYVRPLDFFQLNDIQTEKLYNYIKKLAGDSKRIVDCYAGVGSIGQYVYSGQDLRGIEIVESAVESAKDNCKLNKIDAEYVVGSVGQVLKRWAKSGYRPDLMIFDPPRIGLDKDSINTILKVKPKSVIYVSCNPSTLAKDINLLKQKYKIESVQPFDMFPQTSHVETVVRLQRQNP